MGNTVAPVLQYLIFFNFFIYSKSLFRRVIVACVHSSNEKLVGSVFQKPPFWHDYY